MSHKTVFRSITMLVMATLIGIVGCQRELDLLEPAGFPKIGEIFLDTFSAGLQYAAFGGSKLDAFDVDKNVTYKGLQSMRFAVPNQDDPQGLYAGGAFFTGSGRDLTGFDALTFWAKASKGATLDVVGFGNDLGALQYVTTRTGLLLNTNWRKYVIPIPDPNKLTNEKGMFFYSEGPEDGLGYTFWIDEVQFEKIGTVSNPRPVILAQQNQAFTIRVGNNLNIGGTSVTYNGPDGTDIEVIAAPAYFDFTSSDETVATVDSNGVITAVGIGEAKVTARLGSVDAVGSMAVTVLEAPPLPASPAPTPMFGADSVVSLFSNTYTDIGVSTWSADWDDANVEDIQIDGNDVKLYTNLVFAGIDFSAQQIDAAAKSHFHMDIWTPDPTELPAAFLIKIVDFGPDGIFGNDDSEHTISVDANSTPPLTTGNWVSIDVPVSSLTGLTSKNNVAQIILEGALNIVYVDNVYFYGTGEGGGNGGNGPTAPAPTPSAAPGDVISLFSNAYTNVSVDTWSADFDDADVADVQIAGNDAKLYTNLVFAAVEFTSQTVDASAMNRFHMDIWTPDPTAAPVEFKVKLVDFGANGVFDETGGDDSEHELTFTATSTPALATGNWVAIDVPLSDFVGLASTEHLAQLILVGGPPNTVYVDNLYFYAGGGGGGTEPSAPAPTPTQAAGDVISLFSNAYTNVNVDTWSATWPDDADVEDFMLGSDDMKKYTNLVFAGIEFTSQTVDATAMTHFHLDYWTPDPTAAPALFKIKLVDFGANGVFDGPGSDDVDHELTFDATTNPALATGNWVSFDIPLSDFTGLTTTGHMAQMILVSDPDSPNTVFIDNVYFYNSGGGGGGDTEPSAPAPTPTQAAGDVISLFSNAYTNVNVDTWSATWPDDADVEDFMLGSDDMKKYTNLVFAGIEFTSQTVDATAMTHFHLDYWTPDPTAAPALFKIKLVDFGANGVFDGPGSDDVDHELTFDATTNPALATGNWVSFDIPLSDFTGLTTTGHMAQMILVSDPDSPNTVFIDNVYFYNSGGGGGGDTEPSAPAPTPTQAAGDVISLFSNAYTNVNVDTWSATWPDDADVEDFMLGSDDMKKYTNLVFAGIEFTSQTVDATAMTHFHLDYWTPDPTAAPALFKIKLVDFGANGVFDGPGSDDVDHELTFDATTNPALATGNWVSFDIPLSDFTGLTTTGHMAQMILVSDPDSPNTVFIDNVYFYK